MGPPLCFGIVQGFVKRDVFDHLGIREQPDLRELTGVRRGLGVFHQVLAMTLPLKRRRQRDAVD